jgi:hypothetical protein
LTIGQLNILTLKRRAHLAIADKDFEFHVQCFMAGVQFFHQAAESPKSYSKAMKAPDAASWSDAIDSKLGAIDSLGLWEIIDIPCTGAELLSTVWIFQKKFDGKPNSQSTKLGFVRPGILKPKVLITLKHAPQLVDRWL